MIVKCVSITKKHLTLGAEYTVIKERGGAYKVLADNGRFDWFGKSNFLEVNR